jgi:hypothetical protein
MVLFNHVMIFPGSILEKLGEYTAARNDPTILAKCSLLHLAFNRSRWNIVYSSHIKLQCFEANVIGRQIKPLVVKLKTRDYLSGGLTTITNCTGKWSCRWVVFASYCGLSQKKISAVFRLPIVATTSICNKLSFKL